jgi:hypothetical protein
MPAKKTKALKAPEKAAPSAAPDIWSRSTGSSNDGIRLARVGEIMSVLWLPQSMEKEVRDKKILAALNMFAELKPQNGVEGMLAAQMVATHSAAMDCLRRAMLPEQTFEGREQSLRHANKLMQTFARQLEVLDKHRGKGQQKITVEHVTVEAGGQAIVGNVTAAAAEAPRPDDAKPMLARPADDFMPMVKDITPAKVPAKSRRAGSGGGDPE